MNKDTSRRIKMEDVLKHQYLKDAHKLKALWKRDYKRFKRYTVKKNRQTGDDPFGEGDNECEDDIQISDHDSDYDNEASDDDQQATDATVTNDTTDPIETTIATGSATADTTMDDSNTGTIALAATVTAQTIIAATDIDEESKEVVEPSPDRRNAIVTNDTDLDQTNAIETDEKAANAKDADEKVATTLDSDDKAAATADADEKVAVAMDSDDKAAAATNNNESTEAATIPTSPTIPSKANTTNTYSEACTLTKNSSKDENSASEITKPADLDESTLSTVYVQVEAILGSIYDVAIATVAEGISSRASTVPTTTVTTALFSTAEYALAGTILEDIYEAAIARSQSKKSRASEKAETTDKASVEIETEAKASEEAETDDKAFFEDKAEDKSHRSMSEVSNGEAYNIAGEL